MNVILDALLANALVALVLAVLAALVSLRIRRPALVHAMWLIVLLKLVTPPLFSIHWPLAERTIAASPAVEDEDVDLLAFLPTPEETVESSESISTRQELIEALGALRAEREAVQAMSSLTPVPAFPWKSWFAVRTVLGSLWLGGSVVWLTVFIWRVVGFNRLLGLGWAADDALQAQAASLAERIGLHTCPQVWIVPGRVSPLLWKFGRRGRLVLPEKLLCSLNVDQRAALLAHEMAHAHRLDHWVRWVESCALGLYWWNPVVWWARRELHQAEEECCDAWVVWILPGAARAYAKALLQTVTFLDARPCLPPVASGAGHVSLLKRRLSMIVNEPLSPRLPKPLFFAALVWGCLVLPFAPAQVLANHVDNEPGLQPPQKSGQSVDQRIAAIEAKLDKVLKALDAQGKVEARSKIEAKTKSEAKPKKASDDARRNDEMSRKKVAEAEARAKERGIAAEARAKALAAQAEERAKAMAANAAERAKASAARAETIRKQTEEIRAKALDEAARGHATDPARKAAEEARKQILKQIEQSRGEMERARRAATEARDRASEGKEKSDAGRRSAEEALKKLQMQRDQMNMQMEKLRAELEMTRRRSAGNARAEALKDKAQAEKDGKKSEKVERRVIVTGDKAKLKADIEKMIKDKMGADFKAEDLKKLIQETADPAKMQELQAQIQSVIRKTVEETNREVSKEVNKAMEEVRKNMATQRQVFEKKQAENNRNQAELRSRVAQSQGRDTDMREVQRRLERLEQRLDKVISSLESQQRRGRPDSGNRQ
jgi:beta-lactamase regulating signal transducer with metallopeptidase domain